MIGQRRLLINPSGGWSVLDSPGRAFRETSAMTIRRQDLLAQNQVSDLLGRVVSFGIGHFVFVDDQAEGIG